MGLKLKRCYKKIEDDIEISDDAIEMEDEKVFLKELLKKIRIELLHEIEDIENEIENIHLIKIQEPLHEKWMNVFHFLSKKWPNESKARARIEAFYIPGLDKFKPARAEIMRSH